MKRGDGFSAHAVIAASGESVLVVWFLNQRPLGGREFHDWASAIEFSEQMRRQNWAIGWRSAPDLDEASAGPR